MTRKQFLQLAIIAPIASFFGIKAAAQLRKPKDGDEWGDRYSKCPIVMLTADSRIKQFDFITGRLLEMSMIGSSYLHPESPSSSYEFVCEVNLTRRNMGWLGENRNELIKFKTDMNNTMNVSADCYIIKQKVVGEKISVKLKAVITDYSDETN